LEKAALSTDYYLEFLDQVLRHEGMPVRLSMEAGENLMNLAYGKPFQAIDVNQLSQEQSVQRVIHLVEWQSEDPADKSRVIEHSPD
jgi:alkylated DNA repair dioxygenase AlkB